MCDSLKVFTKKKIEVFQVIQVDTLPKKKISLKPDVRSFQVSVWTPNSKPKR